MIIGFVIIDNFYDKFERLIRRYGDDIVLEFIWVLISLYHDIGYPATKQQYLICESCGLDPSENASMIEDDLKQMRKKFWSHPDYSLVVDAMDSLFYHISRNALGRWIYDAFARKHTTTPFRTALEMSYIEEIAHGAAGALCLSQFIKKHLENIDHPETREFFYRHILIASISILFHDSRVRKCFCRNSLETIRAEHFPLASLLTYVDILQDDRRDMTGFSSRPDIYREILAQDDKILAVLNREVLTPGVIIKLKNELEEAMRFFIMNGISFLIPNELRN
jgi:hypothetical protein